MTSVHPRYISTWPSVVWFGELPIPPSWQTNENEPQELASAVPVVTELSAHHPCKLRHNYNQMVQDKLPEGPTSRNYGSPGTRGPITILAIGYTSVDKVGDHSRETRSLNLRNCVSA